MGAFIDNEVPVERAPYSHAAGYEACERTEMVACSDTRPEVMERVGERYGVPVEKQYTDYREMINREQPDIVSVATQPEQRAPDIGLEQHDREQRDHRGPGPREPGERVPGPEDGQAQEDGRVEREVTPQGRVHLLSRRLRGPEAGPHDGPRPDDLTAGP